jgi:hypothetical protein
MPEQTFLDEESVQVTTTRFIVRGKTFPVNGITSVSLHRSNPQRGGPIILFLLAIGCGLNFRTHWGFILAAAIFAVFGLWWWVTEPIWFSVRLVTASGESDAFKSKSEALIQRIVHALNEAIVARG